MNFLSYGFGIKTGRFLSRANSETSGESLRIDPLQAEAVLQKETAMNLRKLAGKVLQDPQRSEKREKTKRNSELIERLVSQSKLEISNTRVDRTLRREMMKKYDGARTYRGWERMKNSKLPDGRTHLQMIYDECKSQGVPLEVVFLAITESQWENERRSPAKARGAWQFLAGTARVYGLKVNSKVDERCDWEKSTKAAIRFLKNLRNKTYVWDDELKEEERSKITESDRWQFAMWSYNRDSRLVHKTFLQTKGRARKYTQYCNSSNPRYGRHESARYVNKIMAVRELVCAYETGAERILSSTKKSKADLAYESWTKNKAGLSDQKNYKILLDIKKQYQSEKQGVHTAKYVAAALSVIEGNLQAYADAGVEASQEKTSVTERGLEKLFAEYKNQKNRTVSQRLSSLSHLFDVYEKELGGDDADLVVARGMLRQLRAEQAQVLQEYVSQLKNTDRNIKISVSEDGEFEVKVDRRDPRTNEVHTIDADVVEHTVRSGDTIQKIAIRLSGDPMVSGTVQALIKAINPELEDQNYILKVGQTIRVPGEYVEVPDKKLSDLVREWYPGRTEVETATAIGYVKFLNGMHPDRDVIHPGDVILVPVIRDVPGEATVSPNRVQKKEKTSVPEKKEQVSSRLEKSVPIGRGGTLASAIQNANWKNGRPLKTDAQVAAFAARVAQYVGQIFGSGTVQPTDRVLVGEDVGGVYAKFQRGEHVSAPLRVK